MIAYGPVPSRRLGRSLGINHIPPKVCTYSCVYCQVGRTSRMPIARRPFYEPEQILRAVEKKLARAEQMGEAIDYLSFVPDGEPTLDLHLGRAIDLIRPLGIRIAVITNASFIWREDVREVLHNTDWVSLKIDSVEEPIWRRMNRPHKALQLDSILDGALEFSRSFSGTLVTETMLVAGVNDSAGHVSQVADFLARLQPTTAYLAVPTRPPAEPWVQAPDESAINQAFQILSHQLRWVEQLIGYEGNAFASTGDVEQDLLSITAVHPMREDAVRALFSRAGADWHTIHRLIAKGQLVKTVYNGHGFYMRKSRS